MKIFPYQLGLPYSRYDLTDFENLMNDLGCILALIIFDLPSWRAVKK
jgi:hypothetical protein